MQNESSSAEEESDGNPAVALFRRLLNLSNNFTDQDYEEELDEDFDEEESSQGINDLFNLPIHSNSSTSNSESSENSSDVVFINEKNKSSDENIQFYPVNTINNSDVEILTADEKNEFHDKIKNDIYNPVKLRSILCRLDGVDPNDPIFNEFYGEKENIITNENSK